MFTRYPKFKYGDKVIIKNGFYAGQIMILDLVLDLGFFKGFVYSGSTIKNDTIEKYILNILEKDLDFV